MSTPNGLVLMPGLLASPAGQTLPAPIVQPLPPMNTALPPTATPMAPSTTTAAPAAAGASGAKR